MNLDDFSDIQKFFIVVAFVQDGDVKMFSDKLEKLGNQRNVKLIVQPCPYEAIEFLFQNDNDILGNISGIEETLFWKGLSLISEIPNDYREQLAETYHGYLCSILEQNEEAVRKFAVQLQDLDQYLTSG